MTRLQHLLNSGSRTVVLTGIAGAGKTAVLSAVARTVAGDGRHVLHLTCHESDRDLAFGVLVDLLSSAPESEGILGLVSPDRGRSEAVDALRLRLDVLAWLERMSEDRPVVIVLDDAQWCDASSLSVLGYVSGRIDGSSISLLAAYRGDTPSQPLRRHPVVPLPDLTEPQARALLKSAELQVDALTVSEVIRRARGNPLALLELSRAAIGTDGTIPSSVEVAFGEQLAGLPRPTQDVLLLVAANDGDGDIGVLGRVVPAPALIAALEPAERAGVVLLEGRWVRFRHPLMRSASYAGASAAERVAAHRALAEVYHDAPDRRAWHQAEATVVPDEEVAQALDEAAEMAWTRGAAAEAARLMVRSSDLSPDLASQQDRLLAAISYVMATGNFEWVIDHATKLRRDSRDPMVRAQAGHSAAYALAQTVRSSQARRMLVELLDELVDDPELGWASLSSLAVLNYRSGGDVDEVARWLRTYESATDPQTPDAVPALQQAVRAWVRVMIDPIARPADVLDTVVGAAVPDYPVKLVASHEMLLGAAAWLLNEPEAALERLGRSLDLMREALSPGEMSQTLTARGNVQYSVGQYDAADEAGRLILDIGEARDQVFGLADGYELRARVAAIRGDAERARELCHQVLREVETGEGLGFEVAVRVTMSWARLAEQDLQGAWNEISWLFDGDGRPRHVHMGYRELGHYAALAARVGAKAELRRVVEVAEERIVDPGPFHRIQLARARALVNDEDAGTWHTAAVSEPTAGLWPFELASARLEFGSWLRRHHRPVDARAQLQPAHDVFVRLGTPVSATLAAAELRAAGVVTDAPQDSAWALLTAQEREIVRLAAGGMTNPEIASALYLSPRTVSTHLYNAFPKLGVTSRTQLRTVVPASPS